MPGVHRALRRTRKLAAEFVAVWQSSNVMKYEIKSRLNSSEEEVWNHITTGKCINYELFPFIRMTGADQLHLGNIDRLKLNEPLVISYLESAHKV